MSAFVLLATVVALLPASGLSAGDKTEFFEKEIRPLLAERCWTCHSAETQQGGLRLDSRESLLLGGSRGPSVQPGDPGASLIVQAIRHRELKMPLGGKLSEKEISAIETWIAEGAFWPSDAILSVAGGNAGNLTRSNHWAFRPVRQPALPRTRTKNWIANEVDAFILDRLENNGMLPASEADRRTLIRRVSFDLTGLPPRPDQVEAFVSSRDPDAYENLVGRLIDSQHFGEYWARQWMDWVRYSESHGSQGDFRLPDAWRYRDYLIRAFNANVPYDQMLREYLAGDLLENPRINTKDGLNESMHGPANLRMVEYGYVPVDALDDQVKVVDNQIEVLTKAFQGITVSCARCHDHKFDPITQADYYALYGVLASSRPGVVTVDSPE